MEFINFEADDLDEEQLDLLAENDVIDDESVQEEIEEPSFCRFVNQTRDLNEALNCDNRFCLGWRDLQPEMFISEGRENNDFNELNGSAKLSNKFKRPSVNFKTIFFWCCFVWVFDQIIIW